MAKAEDGWYLPTPPKPVVPLVRYNDDGTVRPNGVFWATQEHLVGGEVSDDAEV